MFHLQYVWQVSCRGCCMWKPHPVLIWTPWNTRVPLFWVLHISWISLPLSFNSCRIILSTLIGGLTILYLSILLLALHINSRSVNNKHSTSIWNYTFTTINSLPTGENLQAFLWSAFVFFFQNELVFNKILLEYQKLLSLWLQIRLFANVKSTADNTSKYRSGFSYFSPYLYDMLAYGICSHLAIQIVLTK